MAAAVVGDDGVVRERAEIPADIGTWEKLSAALTGLLASLDTKDVVGIGVGAAGLVDYGTGRYLYGPNTGLRDLDLRDRLTKRFGIEVRMDNDANCAAWAEHRWGAGRGAEHFLCVTLGTGIGGGFVLAGRPYRGASGGAAEIGHMLVDPDGPACGCGRRGCWEQFASGQALERWARTEVKDHPASALADAASIRGPVVSAAAREGDAFARELLHRLGRWVGWGLGSLVNIFEPERIAISGGLVEAWDLFGPAAVASMQDQIEALHYRSAPEVLPATLGNDAGVVGAASLFFADP